MRIGLFGGSFNPVHNTHIDVASGVRKRLKLDQVLFIPAGNPYHKKKNSMLPASLRFSMVEKAVRGIDGLGLSSIDMASDKPTYTVETLSRAAKLYPGAELFFIMGQDAFDAITAWKDWKDIPKLSNLVAVSRAKVGPCDMENRLKAVFEDISCAGADRWKVRGGKYIHIIGDFDFKISSTLVRRMWKETESLNSYVPEAVSGVIRSNREKINIYWG